MCIYTFSTYNTRGANLLIVSYDLSSVQQSGNTVSSTTRFRQTQMRKQYSLSPAAPRRLSATNVSFRYMVKAQFEESNLIIFNRMPVNAQIYRRPDFSILPVVIEHSSTNIHISGLQSNSTKSSHGDIIHACRTSCPSKDFDRVRSTTSSRIHVEETISRSSGRYALSSHRASVVLVHLPLTNRPISCTCGLIAISPSTRLPQQIAKIIMELISRSPIGSQTLDVVPLKTRDVPRSRGRDLLRWAGILVDVLWSVWKPVSCAPFSKHRESLGGIETAVEIMPGVYVGNAVV